MHGLQVLLAGSRIRVHLYEDIDELVARFVEPYLRNFRDLVKHRKFRSGTKAEVQAQLRDEHLRGGAC